MLNLEEVVGCARALSRRVSVARFETLSVRAQLALVAATDVFVVMHGAALAWAPFLPPWGVMLELKPYGFGTAIRDFYAGNCDWARLSGRSHVSWHNRDKAATQVGS